MSARVVVVGGGYAGIRVAMGLDEVAAVVLVEAKDAFFHHNGSLRALVDPHWAERLVLPYDRLLKHGRVVRGRVVEARPDGVTLSSGDVIPADYLVLATGSTYPFPAKPDAADTTLVKRRLRAAQAATEQAERILVVGAGPVGLELAGEITAAWPDKKVTIVASAPDVIPGAYPQALREELRAQLGARGIAFVLGTRLSAQPPGAPGEFAPFAVTTEDGTRIEADVWYRCYGVVPASDYLGPELAPARGDTGQISVNRHLQVAGYDSVFALGDVADLPEPKMAGGAGNQAGSVVGAITALLRRETELVPYEALPLHLMVPLGPGAGAGKRMGQEELAGPEQVTDIKGRDLLVGYYRRLFGLE